MKKTKKKLKIVDSYIAPDIEVVNVDIDQSILQDSSVGGATVEDFTYDDGWW